ncbi:MAG TPA: C2H2-type zinc finger protein [Nitrososphaeraceae archaeon]|jgi:hypothetical protein|nr:C2H2-type zinc finger protein [Nitrososphaeraceae archaeon]
MSSASANIKSPPKAYKCNLCGRVFNSSESLAEHQKVDHDKASHAPAGVG